MDDQLFGEVHQIFIRRIGQVKLHHRELGIMVSRNPFVPEIAVYFKDPLQPAYNKALQVKLRSDPKVQVHPERIVIGPKRPGGGASRQGLHHGSFHFQKIPVLHEPADNLDDPVAQVKSPAHLRVDDQVEIAHAVAGFRVRQPVPFFRQRAQRF